MNLSQGRHISRARAKIRSPRAHMGSTGTKIPLRFILVLLYVTSILCAMHNSAHFLQLIPLLWAWSEAWVSMFIMMHGIFTPLPKKTWVVAFFGQAASWLMLRLQQPDLTWVTFDAFNVLLAARFLGNRGGGLAVASLLGIMSPVAGLLIGRQHVVGKDEVLAAIALLWAQAYIWNVYLLWHTQYSQKVQMSFPAQEERLKTRVLICSVLTTLVSLVPYYLDTSSGVYLLGSFVMGVGYLGTAGLSIISSPSQRTKYLTWQQYISEVYLMGIFTLFVCQYG